MDVEPFPRVKLMKLYYLTLAELKDLPDVYQYKFLCQEFTRFRMKVVDENESIRDIEDKVGAGLIEDLVFQAHNELKLLRIMKRWKPWEFLATRDFEEKEMLTDMLNFKSGNPFPQTWERYDNQKHEKPVRHSKQN